MQKEEKIELVIKKTVKLFLDRIKHKKINIISHFDTDGISSAAIMIHVLKDLDKEFKVSILKNLEREFIETLPKDDLVLFLDLGSGSIEHLKNTGIEDIFIIDHHEIPKNAQIPKQIKIINPQLHDKQKISSSGLTYLFAREIDEKNKAYAKLAILGMVGDTLEKEIGNLNHDILKDSEIQKKRGLLIYPSTRPINRALEYSSHPFIPGITGDTKGVLELLREINIKPENGKYKALMDLNEEEMKKLVTAIMLRNPQSKDKEIIGDIFLLKFFNQLEDARELSAMINACSRLGESTTALKFCMEIPNSKKKAGLIHTKYKQHIISGLKIASKLKKEYENFVIINAQDKIKDTIIGTITSILSKSSLYREGTVIISMALTETKNKIKISARNVGEKGKNVREILENTVQKIGGEVGGHEFAAGCLIDSKKEQEFIDNIKKQFEIETVKIIDIKN